LEEQLLQLPGVVQAAAIPVTTPEGFTRLRAFVVLEKEDVAKPEWQIDATDARLKALLPAWTLRPDRLVVLEALPATPTGKVLRRELYRLVNPQTPAVS
jgi:acyl-coenzyme A synthetase/AMP-(fatty) acid ligase